MRMKEPTNLDCSRLLKTWFASPKFSVANSEGELSVETQFPLSLYSILLLHTSFGSQRFKLPLSDTARLTW